MAARYYVAQIHPGAEQVARAELVKAGIAVILLTRIYEIEVDRVRPWRGGAQRSAPLFPGYLFLNMDLADQGWRIAASRRGVHRLLGTSPETPLAVPVGVVEELVARWQAGAFDARRAAVGQPRVQVAQTGLVTQAGHFVNRVGECIYSSAKRVDLLIGLMRVSFPAAQVVPAG